MKIIQSILLNFRKFVDFTFSKDYKPSWRFVSSFFDFRADEIELLEDPERFNRYLRLRYLFSDKNPTSVITTTIKPYIYDSMRVLITHLKTYKIPVKNIKKLTLKDDFSSNSDSSKRCSNAPVFPGLVELVITR